MSSGTPYPWPPRDDDFRSRAARPPQPSLLGPLLFLLVFCTCLLGLSYWFRPHWFRTSADHDPSAAPRAVTARGDLADDEKATIAIYKKTIPSVVHITTLANRQDFFSLNVEQVPEGTGSGFIWDEQGHVVTNFHVIRNVVRNGGAATVTLADQSSHPARLVGAYPDKDLAVLKIDAPRDKLVPLAVGRSDDLQVGQKVFAIGNPFGLDQTLTNGIISALGREIESTNNRPIKNMIQTNAAINPGNSGGPLLDSEGRLIGVNTAIFSPSGASAGIGFAIPVDEVNQVVPELIRSGKVSRPALGIHPAPDQLVRWLGIEQEGVLFIGLTSGGGAEKAGLRPTHRDRRGQIVLGDIITAVDGKPVKKVSDLYGALDRHKEGDAVTVKIVRDGAEVEVSVELGAIN